jgi:predicted nucleic acid-binding protein
VIVVSNASSITNLATIGQTNLLEQLYGEIFVPDAVFRELTAIGSERLDSTILQALSRVAARSVANRALTELPR